MSESHHIFYQTHSCPEFNEVLAGLARCEIEDLAAWNSSLCTGFGPSLGSHLSFIAGRIDWAIDRLQANKSAKEHCHMVSTEAIWDELVKQCEYKMLHNQSEGYPAKLVGVEGVVAPFNRIACCNRFGLWVEGKGNYSFTLNFSAEHCAFIKAAATAVKYDAACQNPMHISDLKEWFFKLSREPFDAVLIEVASKTHIDLKKILYLFKDDGSLPPKQKQRVLTTMTAEYKKYNNEKEKTMSSLSPKSFAEIVPPAQSTPLPTDVASILKNTDITWISVSGAKGSGKDTFCSGLVTHLQKEIKWNKRNEPEGYIIEYKWAEPLKAAASMLYGWSREDLEDYDFKEAVCPRWNVKPRDILKDLSEEFLKKRNKDFILQFAAEFIADKVRELTLQADVPIYVVISDSRFPAEIGFLRSFQLWNNHTVVSYRMNRDSADTTDTHVSEQRLPDNLIDHEINNNCISLVDLEQHIAANAVKKLLLVKTPEEITVELNSDDLTELRRLVTNQMNGIKENYKTPPNAIYRAELDGKVAFLDGILEKLS